MKLRRVALGLIILLSAVSCKSVETIAKDKNITYQEGLNRISSLDKGGRWLSLGIKEINELAGILSMEMVKINHHLLNLIDNREYRFDTDLHKIFINELRETGVSEEAITIVERAHIRVSSPLNLHDGYWVGKLKPEGSAFSLTVINDMHIDAATNLVTVYAQSKMLGKVVAPAQINPGEFTELPNGERVASHPDAVYLNGSGQELMKEDGSGSWWVKHSWVLGGEGYVNAELKPQESYQELYVEGNLLSDGLTMKIGDPGEKWGYNLRAPVIDGNSVKYIVTRYEFREDGTIEEGFVLNWSHKNKKSAFNGLKRSAPDIALFNLLVGDNHVE